MKLAPQFARRHSRQAGYMLLSILLLMSLLVIAAAYQAPRIAQQIRREREEEMIHRGMQYTRAIKRFYRKFGRYPNRLEELENTNNLRFLRKAYKDPMTPEGKWRVLRFGENKTPGVGAPANVVAQSRAMAGGALPGGIGTLLGQPGPRPGAPGQPQASGTPAFQISRPAGGGPTIGGGPIIGVTSTSEKAAIKEINGYNHYNEWEFIYDPRYDQPAGQGAVGAPAGQPAQPLQPQPKPGAVPR